MRGYPCKSLNFELAKHVMISIYPLAFTVYLIFSASFDPVRSASFTSNEENDKPSYLTNRLKSLKIEGNGPIDALETFEEHQETGPFRVNRMKTSLSCESLNSASSGKYSPLARLALSNSQRESFVGVQGDEVNKLVSRAEDEDEEEEKKEKDYDEISEEKMESCNIKYYDNLKLEAKVMTKKNIN